MSNPPTLYVFSALSSVYWLTPRIVGLSRQRTADEPPPPPPKDDYMDMSGLEAQKTITNGHTNGHAIGMQPLDTQRTFTNGQLFTADELANALSVSTLKPSKRERS